MRNSGTTSRDREAAAPDETHFGFTTVPLAEKQDLVDDVFHKVARALRPDERPDVGRPAPRLEGRAGLLAAPAAGPALRAISTWPAAPATSPSACSTPPGRRPTSRCSTSMPTCWPSAASARRLGFDGQHRLRRGQCRGAALPDKAFDAYTIAFGIRNVPRIELALAEAYRVLKRGGRFLCLEFSQVDVPVLDTDLRRLFLHRRAGARQGGHRRRRALPLPRGIDPQVPAARGLRGDDPARPASGGSADRP